MSAKAPDAPPLGQRRELEKGSLQPVSLYCLPYAGGNAYAYRPLETCCPPGLSLAGIELPGRGRRAREALCFSLEELADDVFEQLRGRINGRYALFGHSMGATLAYLCLERIRCAGLPPPEALFLSGREAPSRSKKNVRHLLPRDEFIAMLRELGGLPSELLQEKELIDYFEPILRADFQAVETWQYRPQEAQPVPLVVLRGLDDEVTRDDAQAWARETTRAFELHEFDGNHFFIQQHWPRIASVIERVLGLARAPAVTR